MRSSVTFFWAVVLPHTMLFSGDLYQSIIHNFTESVFLYPLHLYISLVFLSFAGQFILKSTNKWKATNKKVNNMILADISLT